MTHDLLMPKLGLTMTEGVLAEWRVRPGQPFKAGDVLLVIETDKTSSEVEAEADGVLVDIVIDAGQTVACGSPVARWSSQQLVQGTVDTPAKPRVLSTPLARRMAREQGIDLRTLKGTGPGGRIKACDIDAVRGQQVEPPVREAPAAAAPPSARQATPSQRNLARRLTAAKQDVPHFYLAAEAEVSALSRLRRELNQVGTRKLTLSHFILAAVGRALRDRPDMDRVWQDGEIVELNAGDVGLAVNAERGLIVPILRDVGTRPLDWLARDADAAIAAARAGKLTEAELQGGAVTVSNAGMFNVSYMTSIINPGQSSILGVGSVREVFRPGPDGAPLLKRELGLVLSADHRLLDGVSALGFLNLVIGYLERPMALLRSP